MKCDRAYCDSFMGGDGECGLQAKYRDECEHWKHLTAQKDKVAYVVFCQDRHLDPVIEVFYEEAEAIGFAREFMESHMGTPTAIKEEDIKGYSLYLTYMDEGDHAFVKQIEIK